MKMHCFALALGIIAATPSIADSTQALDDLAADTGLTERELRMALGARTAFAEYRTSRDRVLRRVERALEARAAAVEVNGIAKRQ
ncbi:MAG: hypothetical protein LW860_06400 [Xanthomonadaceae bacterium]|jgi:hypothetical protein|nr:hypothetical protein [Xanthomonadaceae bacterium]